ncbi:MAG: tRNA (adenosine(37)-N6)-threonylcarbamoyltransferase complex dimerization subunit type 1 TsaB [Croceibacterium sp.]
MDPRRTLVIECATDACSAALFERGELLGGGFEVIGRGHAERLVPMIAELPGKGRAVRIVVSLGPGSFTGVRIGLAAARALGLAWQAEVLGYPTLTLVAAMAAARRPGPVTVCMTGGHGEWFVQPFAADGMPEATQVSLAPEQAAAGAHTVVAGSQAEALVALRGSGEALPLLPDARAFILLNAALLTPDLAPIYGRAPDARLPGVAG